MVRSDLAAGQILEKRTSAATGGVEYLVQWHGYGLDACTWDANDQAPPPPPAPPVPPESPVLGLWVTVTADAETGTVLPCPLIIPPLRLFALLLAA